MKDFEKQYNETFEKFLNDKITWEEWNEYCRKCLENLLQEPEIKAVLKNMKER